MSDPQKNTDPAAVRSALWARLEGARGRDYWRSLDDLAATPEFQDLLEREFGVNVMTAHQAIVWDALRRCGVNDKIEGFGRLFREF